MKVMKFTAGAFSEVYIIFYEVLWIFLTFSSPSCTQCELFLSLGTSPPPSSSTRIETSKISLSLRQEEDDKEEKEKENYSVQCKASAALV